MADFFFFNCATSPQYTRRTFRCFYPNVSRATLVLNDHLTKRRGRSSRSRWIPGIRYALPISTARPIYPPWLVWPSRDFPQITRICLPTLTFLAQQISIILMKSGRESCAKFVWKARTGFIYTYIYSCICSLHRARARGQIPNRRFYEKSTGIILGVCVTVFKANIGFNLIIELSKYYSYDYE